MRTFLILLIICSSFYYIANKKLSKITVREDNKNLTASPNMKNKDYEVVQILKRPQSNDYTQGVFFSDNGETLFESGGLYGESVLVKIDYPNLTTTKIVKLANEYFAEGIAKCQNYLYQLTWRERKILKYSYPNLDYVDHLSLDSLVKEGWGLSETSSASELVASDGSTKLYFLDCNDGLKVKRSIEIKFNDQPVDRLNDLTFGNGFIWANRYYDNRIFKINPIDGEVVKVYDLSALVDYEMNHLTLTNLRFTSGDVLNGIAFNKSNGRFLLSGKKWGFYYDINFK